MGGTEERESNLFKEGDVRQLYAMLVNDLPGLKREKQVIY